MIETVPLHQMVRGGPIAVAVEHRARNASAQHSRKCLLVTLGLPVSNNFFAGWEAANMQPSLVCRPTTKTLKVWRVCLLNALFSHSSCDGRIVIRRLHRFKIEQQQQHAESILRLSRQLFSSLPFCGCVHRSLLRSFCGWHTQLL